MPCSGSNTVTNATPIGCVNAVDAYAAQTETLALTTLSVGTSYFVRIIAARAAGAANTSISLRILSPQPNDEPTGAISLDPVPSTTVCNYVGGNLKGASTTTCGGLTSPPCGNWGSTSVDLWYSVTVPLSGEFFLQTDKSNSTSLGMAVYSGSPCSSLSLIKCSEGNPEGSVSAEPAMFVDGQTGGNTLYVRIWNKDAASNACSFSVCATSNGPCGNPKNVNDYCELPYAIYTSGVTGTMSAIGYTGTPTYTHDQPSNLGGESCSSVYPFNNAWYSFVANSTTETIPFTTSAGCNLEVNIYSVATNTYGCCKTFTNVSGFHDPDPNIDGDGIPCTDPAFTWSIAPASSANVVASGLLPGQTYYMMVNYPSGSACSFSVTGWAYTGVLSIDFVSFTAIKNGNHNQIKWIVENEAKIDSYTLEHSENATEFYPIKTIYSKNNSTSNVSYEAIDYEKFNNITYYRIKTIMKDGKINYTNIINVTDNPETENIYNIHPNPTNSDLYFEYYSKYNGQIDVELISYAGAVSLKQNNFLEEGKNNITIPMSKLEDGVYILKVTSQKTGKTTYHKVVKN
jgi:hypothetical protein